MTEKPTVSETKSEREIVRKQLLDAGMLLTDIEIPEVPDGYTEKEIESMLPIILPPNTPTWAELLDEERG